MSRAVCYREHCGVGSVDFMVLTKAFFFYTHTHVICVHSVSVYYSIIYAYVRVCIHTVNRCNHYVHGLATGLRTIQAVSPLLN